jgi:hypothetical protein
VNRPVLLGPDIAAFTGGTGLPDYFKRFLGAVPKGALHALTWHQYPYCNQPDEDHGTILSLSCLGKLDQAAETFSSLAAVHGTPVAQLAGRDLAVVAAARAVAASPAPLVAVRCFCC